MDASSPHRSSTLFRDPATPPRLHKENCDKVLSAVSTAQVVHACML